MPDHLYYKWSTFTNKRQNALCGENFSWVYRTIYSFLLINNELSGLGKSEKIL